VIATNVMQEFPEYTFASNTLEDADWGIYLDFLFPEPADMQSIKNGRVLRMMEEQGDEQHIPRAVSHFFYFASESDRAACRKEAEALGYTLVQEGTNEKSPEAPYSLVISKVESLNEETMHTATLQLFQLAETHKGTYDGWEAQVIREND
jgi:regulator of RNase E activity RraB